MSSADDRPTFFKPFSKISEIQIYIAIFVYNKNALKWVQTSLVLVL